MNSLAHLQNQDDNIFNNNIYIKRTNGETNSNLIVNSNLA